MECEGNRSKRLMTKCKSISSPWQSLKYYILYTLTLIILFIFLRPYSSPFDLLLTLTSTSTPPANARQDDGPVTFLPLKDIRYAETAMDGNTWFMSSLNDTFEEGEAEHLHFPSKASQGRLLCLKGRDARNGSRNSYALARSDALPEGSKLLPGLTFVSDTYYDYENLWHGLTAIVPFVGWSMKNRCVKPKRWILYHQGEIRSGMGSWVRQVVEANYGEEVQMESFEGEGAGGEDDTYCLEEAVVMRHNLGKMGEEKKLKVSDQVRCKARERCGVHGGGKDNTSTAEVNETGKPLIRMTLLMRRGSRSFKNASAVVNVFAGECKRFSGCLLKVVQSEELSFCDQVRVMTETDIVVSPHGAQLTNMVFMERGSSVMELFPRGWLELAGVGQYAHHWMAKMAGMNHRGAWWEPLADGKKECPDPKDDARCFTYYKNGKVGHNEIHFASWARDVLNQVRTAKLTEVPSENPNPNPSRCPC